MVSEKRVIVISEETYNRLRKINPNKTLDVIISGMLDRIERLDLEE